jgi:hypothetical protein
MLQRLFFRLSIGLIFGLATILVACGGENGQDIEPVETIEAQTVPERATTEAPTPPPTAQPTPSPTGLPTELVEPVSPVPSAMPTQEVLKMPQMSPNVELVPGSEQAVSAATADLARQTGLPSDQIRLVSIEAQQWSDTSLGCPQEGYMYAQVITPGYLIVLEAQGQQYEYHTDQGTNVILCQP